MGFELYSMSVCQRSNTQLTLMAMYVHGKFEVAWSILPMTVVAINGTSYERPGTGPQER